MLHWIHQFLQHFHRKKSELPVVSKKELVLTEKGIFGSSFLDPMIPEQEALEMMLAKYVPISVRAHMAREVGDSKVAMDQTIGYKGSLTGQSFIPQSLLAWYGNQGFIGHQVCAIVAQHWLVFKACNMPARDAIRQGYEITVNDGTEVNQDVLDAMRKADVRYRIDHNLEQFMTMGRIFGIRIAMFKVESDDPGYYEKPFNPDGVTPGSYKGIVQIDPYWVTPELDLEAGADPSSQFFYEPTWWRINTQRYHRTHLMIFRNSEVADILKPTYLYGGIPVPQKVYERIYCAERTANEAPQLALTKRSIVVKTDINAAIANQGAVQQRMQAWSQLMSNYGIRVIDEDEEVTQLDTSLNDLDAVIMTQYQIVAGAANVPVTKLLGTTPKGFNSSGDYDEKSYHEELESIQKNDLTPLLERHHLLLIRSEIAPQFNVSLFATTVVWNPVSTMSAEELALVNKTKADTGAVLVASGAIDGMDERQRVITDPESGYTGIAYEGILQSLAGGDPIQDPQADPEMAPELEENVQHDPDEGSYRSN